MTTLNANVQFTCTEKGLSAEEKLQAIQNEVQQSFYTEEEYDEAVYGKWISIFDTWMGVEDAEERNNTSLDPLFLEEWIDVELLCQVRMLHQGIKVPSEIELENYDKLNDCLSVNHSGRDKKKFAVMNTPGYETKYHMLPGGWMFASLVKSNSPYTRKVIWNEEWNFEEIIENDRPDWVLEAEAREEAKAKAYKETKARKMLWKQIRDDRKAYKKYYDGYDLLKWVDSNRASKLKKLWDRYYKDYKYYSKLQDELTAIDEKDILKEKTKQAENILHLFVTFQQEAPSSIVDKLLREDVKAYYKKYWYNSTISYLNKAIRKAKQLA